MSAESFERALAARGIPCHVEAREKLAVLVATGSAGEHLSDAATRRELHALAATHGFSHVALELLADDGETLPGH